jgi:hypothetical protein
LSSKFSPVDYKRELKFYRLSEKSSWKVLLLEAEGEEPDVALITALDNPLFESKLDRKYITQPRSFNCGGYGCSLSGAKFWAVAAPSTVWRVLGYSPTTMTAGCRR